MNPRNIGSIHELPTDINGGFMSTELVNNELRSDVERILRGEVGIKYHDSGNFSNAYLVKLGHMLSLRKRKYIIKTQSRETSLNYQEEMSRYMTAYEELHEQLHQLGIHILNPLYANNNMMISRKIKGRKINKSERTQFVYALSSIMRKFMRSKWDNPLWTDIVCDYNCRNFIKEGAIYYWIDPFFNHKDSDR